MPTGGDPQKQIQGLSYEEDLANANQKRGAAAAGGTVKNIYPVAPFQVPTDKTANGNGVIHWVLNKDNTAAVTTGTSEPTYYVSDYRANRGTYNTAYADGYEFVVVDFEFGTDQYAYQIDGVWETGTEVPAGAENVKPALVATPIYYTTWYRNDRGAFNSKATTTADNAGINIIEGPDGLYYASADANYSEDDVRLSNEVGVYDHVTFVMKAIKTEKTYTVGENTYNYYKAVKYAYVNGQYLQSSAVTEDKNGVALDLVLGGRIGFSFSGANKKIDNYSLAIDNLCTNWYKEGYDYGANGLNKFFGDGFDASVALYECDNIVYQEDYVTDFADRWIEVDGTRYYNINAGLDAITNGSDVVVNANVNYFAPSQSLVEFNLELLGGSDFEISKGIYTFTPNGANSYKVEQSSAMANLALVDGIKFSLYVDAENGAIKSVSGIEEAIFAWDSANNCYEIIWASELDNYDPNYIKVCYSEGDSIVCNQVKLDIGTYASIAVEEFECGSEELTLLYEVLKYKEKALISNIIENVEANLSANGALKLFDGNLRVQYKLGYNACGIKIHDITNAYKNTLLEDTLVVSYFDGENMVDLTVANGGITHAKTPNEHFFVNVPVEFITSTVTITFEAPVALDKTDANNWTYTETVPVTGTYSYAEDAGLTAIIALNALFDAHENCTCTKVDLPKAEEVDFSAFGDEISFMYDNAGVYVYGADDSLTVSYYYGSDLVTLTVGDGIEKLYEGEYYVHGIHAAFLADVITVKVGKVEGTYNLAAFIDYAIEARVEFADMLAELNVNLPLLEEQIAALAAALTELNAVKADFDAPVLKLNADWEAAKADVLTAETNFEAARDSYQNFVDQGLDGTQMGLEAKAALDAAEAVLAEKQAAAATAEAAYTAALNELNAKAEYVQLLESIEENAAAIDGATESLEYLEEMIVYMKETLNYVDSAIVEANEMARYSAAAKAYKVSE